MFDNLFRNYKEKQEKEIKEINEQKKPQKYIGVEGFFNSAIDDLFEEKQRIESLILAIENILKSEQIRLRKHKLELEQIEKTIKEMQDFKESR